MLPEIEVSLVEGVERFVCMYSIGRDVFFLASLQSVEGPMIPSDTSWEWKESMSLQLDDDPSFGYSSKSFAVVSVSLPIIK